MELSMDSRKAVIKAAKQGDSVSLAQLLDREPALIHARDVHGSTPLHCAAWKGHAEAVARLLERGADPNAQSENSHYGGTPLHAAAHANQRAIVASLLDARADPNAISCNGRTPLQETEIHNATAAAKLLRERGGS
jgi:ankyrin repeat protein